MPCTTSTRQHQLREEVINARLWGGIHYRRSSEVGVHLGQKVAHFGLNHAFKTTQLISRVARGVALARPSLSAQPARLKLPLLRR